MSDDDEKFLNEFAEQIPSKRQRNRELIESIHPAEPEEEPSEEDEAYVRRLFGPKPGHRNLIRKLHGEDGEDEQ